MTDEFDLSFDCSRELYELLEFLAGDFDQTPSEYVRGAIWYRIHNDSRNYRETIEVDVELSPEFAHWARLYANAQQATGGDYCLEDALMNHATWEYNWLLDGEPLETDCSSDSDGE